MLATLEVVEDMQVVGIWFAKVRGGQGERGECGSFTGLFWWV